MQNYYTYSSGFFPTPADVASFPTMNDIKIEPEISKNFDNISKHIKMERESSDADSGLSESGQHSDMSSLDGCKSPHTSEGSINQSSGK
jgi:hypothetical protein